MNTENLGTFSVPDGYFGDRINAHVLLDGKSIIHVFPFGFHKSPFLQMDIGSADEAAWLIRNHPDGKRYYKPIQ